MLVSVLTVTSGAVGTLIFSDDFDSSFDPQNWIQGIVCEFKWDEGNGNLYGYANAPVLQSNYMAESPKKWDKFYASVDFKIIAFDNVEGEDIPNRVGLWYRDQFENHDFYGEEIGPAYTYYVNIRTGEATLYKDHYVEYTDSNNIVQIGEINEVIASSVIPGEVIVGENAPWYNIGIRVTDGKIECYFDGEIVISAVADPDDERFGDYAVHSVDPTVGSQKSAILIFNSMNWIVLDNFKVWSEDYDQKSHADADGNGKVDLLDVTAMLKYIAKWKGIEVDTTAADMDYNGKINLWDVSLVLKLLVK